MRFSILIPVYNVEQYLPQCIDSILQQVFCDYEIVLTDDGSTDRSGQICDEYAAQHSNIRVIHQPNQGLVSARRTGMKAASGEYCLFCDSDDRMEPDALSLIDAGLKKNADPDLLIFNAFTFGGESSSAGKHVADGECSADSKSTNNIEQKEVFFEHVFPEGEVDREQLLRTLLDSYRVNAMWLKACRRELLDIETDYTGYFDCSYGEDLLQTVPLVLAAERICYMDVACYDYRVTSGMMKKANPGMYRAYRKVSLRVKELVGTARAERLSGAFAVHLLRSAYSAVIAWRYTKQPDMETIAAIADDKEFRDAFEMLFSKHERHKSNSEKDRHVKTDLTARPYWPDQQGERLKLTRKERLVIAVLYHRQWALLKLILKVYGMK